MELITIPATTLQVSRVCLGTADWDSSVHGTDVLRLLEAYLQQGGNFLDTAHCYAAWLDEGKGNGRSERAVGRAVAQLRVRNRVVIASKGGHPTINDVYRRPQQSLSRQVVERDLAESLERLQMDTIDLYYLHRDDGITPVDEVIETLNGFVRQKRIRYFAASNWRTEKIRQANEYAAARKLQGFCCSQISWALATPTWKIASTEPTVRYPLDADRQWHTQTQLPIIAYSATARGYFATDGKAKDTYDTPENAQRLARARQLAEELGKTTNQIAIAWLMNQPFCVVPITGTVKPEHLSDTMAAAGIRLTEQQVRWLERGQ